MWLEWLLRDEAAASAPDRGRHNHELVGFVDRSDRVATIIEDRAIHRRDERRANLADTRTVYFRAELSA